MPRLIVIVLAGLLVGCTTGGTRITSQWKDPDLVRMSPQRVLVLARFTEPGVRRMMEDRSIEELRELGIRAVAAYKALPALDEHSTAFQQQLRDADALVIYTPGQNYTDVANRPGLGAGVGWGFFGISLGPILGGAKAEQRTTINAQLFPAASPQPVWSVQYDVNLAKGAQKGLADVPERLARQLRSDGAL